MAIVVWCVRGIGMLLVGGLGLLYVQAGDDFHIGIGAILLVQVAAWLDGALKRTMPSIDDLTKAALKARITAERWQKWNDAGPTPSPSMTEAMPSRPTTPPPIARGRHAASR